MPDVKERYRMSRVSCADEAFLAVCADCVAC